MGDKNPKKLPKKKKAVEKTCAAAAPVADAVKVKSPKK